jgi:pimeloyl-ACP methyl ester carboxylesterase
MTTETVEDVGGRATRIERSGRGRPLLWLHDTRGNRWTRGHDALARQHEVIAPSLPGFDDSTTLERIDRPEDVVFWLLDLWDALSLERPVLLGCGLGGWIAAEFAARYPERLGRLMLVDAYGLQVDGALAADEFALTAPMLRPLVFARPQASLARSGSRTPSRRSAWRAPCTRAWRPPVSPGNSRTVRSSAAGWPGPRCPR